MNLVFFRASVMAVALSSLPLALPRSAQADARYETPEANPAYGWWYTSAPISPSNTPLPAGNHKAALLASLPSVKGVTYYPWFNDTEGTNLARAVPLLKQEIPKMQAAGFNAVWMGALFPWVSLNPKPFSSDPAQAWNATNLRYLVEVIKTLDHYGMKAIFPLNYVGKAYAPEGIDGCEWKERPAERAKFFSFVTTLTRTIGAQTREDGKSLNASVLYLSFSELHPECLVGEEFWMYKGYHYTSASTGEFVDVNDPVVREHRKNGLLSYHAKTTYSVGQLPQNLPADVRGNIALGFHDPYLLADDPMAEPVTSGGYGLWGYVPILLENNANPFDFLSLAMYRTPAEVIATQQSSAPLPQHKQDLKNWINAKFSHPKVYFPNARYAMLEFGWPDVNMNTVSASGKELHDKNLQSPLKDAMMEAVVEWSQATGYAFNLWGWTPLVLDSYSYNALEEGYAFTDREKNSSSSLAALCRKIWGQATCNALTEYAKFGVDQFYRIRGGQLFPNGGGYGIRCDAQPLAPCVTAFALSPDKLTKVQCSWYASSPDYSQNYFWCGNQPANFDLACGFVNQTGPNPNPKCRESGSTSFIGQVPAPTRFTPLPRRATAVKASAYVRH